MTTMLSETLTPLKNMAISTIRRRYSSQDSKMERVNGNNSYEDEEVFIARNKISKHASPAGIGPGRLLSRFDKAKGNPFSFVTIVLLLVVALYSTIAGSRFRSPDIAPRMVQVLDNNCAEVVSIPLLLNPPVTEYRQVEGKPWLSFQFTKEL
jgi:hypothetical protein